MATQATHTKTDTGSHCRQQQQNREKHVLRIEGEARVTYRKARQNEEPAKAARGHAPVQAVSLASDLRSPLAPISNRMIVLGKVWRSQFVCCRAGLAFLLIGPAAQHLMKSNVGR